MACRKNRIILVLDLKNNWSAFLAGVSARLLTCKLKKRLYGELLRVQGAELLFLCGSLLEFVPFPTLGVANACELVYFLSLENDVPCFQKTIPPHFIVMLVCTKVAPGTCFGRCQGSF